MSKKKTAANRPPIKRSELLLLLIPCLVVGLIVVGVMIRKAATVPTIEVDGYINWTNVSSDGKHILLKSVSSNGISSASGWNLVTQETEWERRGARASVWGTPSPSVTKYLKRSAGTIEVSAASSGNVIGTWPQFKKSYYAWLDDEKWMLQTGKDAALVDSANGRVIKKLPHQRWFRASAGVRMIKISPDRKRAAVREDRTGSFNSAKQPTSDVQPGGRLAIVSWPAGVKLAEAPGDMYQDFTWTADSRYVHAITGPVTGSSLLLQASLAQLDVVSGKIFWTHLPVNAPNGERLVPTYATLSPDGRFIAVPYRHTGVVVYDAKDATVKLDIASMKQSVSKSVPPLFGPNNKFVIRTGGNKVELHDLPQD